MEAIGKTIIDRYLCVIQKSHRMRTVLDNKFQLEVPHDDETLDHEILNSFRYSYVGKKMSFTKVFFNAFNYWYKGPEEIVNIMAPDMSLTSHSVIMLDDVQDKSLIRRGRPCVHLIYGVPRVLITVGFMMSQIIYDLINTNKAELAASKIDLLIHVLRGQAMEIYWRDNFICPTEEEYKSMALMKTGSFFFMCIDWLSGNNPENLVDVTPIGEAITLYFQIVDDYQSLADAEYQATKGFCQDITEGKFSFPVIYVINNFVEEGKIVLDILKERTHDIDRLNYCRSIIQKCGGLEYTKQVFSKYKEIIISLSEKLGPNPVFKEFLVRYLDGSPPLA